MQVKVFGNKSLFTVNNVLFTHKPSGGGGCGMVNNVNNKIETYWRIVVLYIIYVNNMLII